MIGRKGGRSAVAAAAYRAGAALRDERGDRVHDYRCKRDVRCSQVLAPRRAPEWMRDRERLWNAVETAERRRDAQLVREVQLALPRELGPEDQWQLARGFVRRAFVARGMIADVTHHRPRTRSSKEAQDHVHVMLTMRVLTAEGFGKKERAWNATGLLEGWRAEWAAAVNGALEVAGSRARVDHRTLEAQRWDAEDEAAVARAAGDEAAARAAEVRMVEFDRAPEPKRGVRADVVDGKGREDGERRAAWEAVRASNERRRAALMAQLEARWELAEAWAERAAELAEERRLEVEAERDRERDELRLRRAALDGVGARFEAAAKRWVERWRAERVRELDAALEVADGGAAAASEERVRPAAERRAAEIDEGWAAHDAGVMGRPAGMVGRVVAAPARWVMRPVRERLARWGARRRGDRADRTSPREREVDRAWASHRERMPCAGASVGRAGLEEDWTARETERLATLTREAPDRAEARRALEDWDVMLSPIRERRSARRQAAEREVLRLPARETKMAQWEAAQRARLAPFWGEEVGALVPGIVARVARWRAGTEAPPPRSSLDDVADRDWRWARYDDIVTLMIHEELLFEEAAALYAEVRKLPVYTPPARANFSAVEARSLERRRDPEQLRGGIARGRRPADPSAARAEPPVLALTAAMRVVPPSAAPVPAPLPAPSKPEGPRPRRGGAEEWVPGGAARPSPEAKPIEAEREPRKKARTTDGLRPQPTGKAGSSEPSKPRPEERRDADAPREEPLRPRGP